MAAKKTKNKDFLKWTRAESCFRKDNIVSTDWHEKLERIPMFEPTYAKCRPDMYQIMSMEYGRMWHREKDDWFAEVFKPDAKEQNLKQRQKKLRREFLEAKRKADIKIKERKEKMAREKEAKAKAEAEAHEKARRAKAKSEKRPIKKKDKKESKSEISPSPAKTQLQSQSEGGECPKGWTQVELTVQCECQANKGKQDGEKSEEGTGASDPKAGKPRKESDESKREETKETEAKEEPERKEPETKEAEAKEGEKKTEKPCDEECMPAQIAQALGKSFGNESGNGDDSQQEAQRE